MSPELVRAFLNAELVEDIYMSQVPGFPLQKKDLASMNSQVTIRFKAPLVYIGHRSYKKEGIQKR